MWIVIAFSIFAGWLVGVTISNFDKIKPYLIRNVKSQPTPPVYTRPLIQPVPQDDGCDCGPTPPTDMLNNRLQSMFQPKSESNLDTMLEEYEQEHDSKVIFINHQSKSGSILGQSLSFLDSMPSLSKSDVRDVLDILRDTPKDKTLDIILHTNGGSLTAAEVITKALISHEGTIRVHIPYYAESAGTLVALAGNEIHIGQGGWLTQVDPQLGYWSAASVLEASKTQGTSWFSDILRLTNVSAQKAMDRAVDIFNYIATARGYTEQEIHLLCELLVEGKSNHDKPLTEDLLVNVKGLDYNIDSKIMELYRAHCKN